MRRLLGFLIHFVMTPFMLICLVSGQIFYWLDQLVIHLEGK